MSIRRILKAIRMAKLRFESIVSFYASYVLGKFMLFRNNTRGSSMKEVILYIVALILDLACVPVVVDQVQDVNTTGWTFTGYVGAKTLLLLIPFAFIAGVLVKALIGALRED